MTNPALPSVTVIVPIRNEEGFIANSLTAIVTQDYPKHLLEVLVADGMSTDATREIVQQIAAENQDVTLKLIDNAKQIVPSGFNLALSEASGEIIVRVDGHTIIEPDYVAQCVKALGTTDADNVGGRMNPVGKNAVGKAIALATSSPFGVGGASFHYSDKQEWVDTVYMGAWRREIFARVGNFDEEFVRNQDDEFNYRLRRAGGKILLSPAIKSAYYNRSSLRALWTQYYHYGLYKVRVMQKNPRQMRPRQFAPLALVLALGGGAILAPFSGLIRWCWLGVCVAYALANLAASAITSRHAQRRFDPLLPLVFAILHFSYGLGFLVGLVKFANRWQTDTSGTTANLRPD